MALPRFAVDRKGLARETTCSFTGELELLCRTCTKDQIFKWSLPLPVPSQEIRRQEERARRQEERAKRQSEEQKAELQEEERMKEMRRREKLQEERRKRWQAYRNIIKRKGSLPLRIVKLLITGSPRVGKSSLKKWLVGISLSELAAALSSSTGVAEAPVKVIIRKLAQSVAQISGLKWSELSIDEEAVRVLRFVLEEAASIANEPESEKEPTTSSEPYVSRCDAPEHYSALSDAMPLPPSESTPPFATAQNPPKVEESSLLSIQSKPSIVPPTPKSKRSEVKRALEASKPFLTVLNAAMIKEQNQQAQELLRDTTTIHIIDTGGQPEFHELLPALVAGPAINLILFKLNESLLERCMVEYVSPDGKLTEPYVTSYTHEDVIFRSLATIACFSKPAKHSSSSDSVSAAQPTAEYTTTEQEAVAVLIGTHMDRILEDREEKIREIDESLKTKIEKTEFYTKGLVEFFDPQSEQMVVPINNRASSEAEAGITALRDLLNRVIEEKFEPIEIPPAWLTFDLAVRKTGAKILSFKKCLRISQRCGIETEEEFREALWYLHHQLGLLMYYPEIPVFRDVVIVDIRLLFDCITDLITNTFVKGKVTQYEQHLFKEKGQFLSERMRKICYKKRSPLSLDRLVHLLRYLHILTDINLEDGRPGYFMPCVLKPKEVKEVSHCPQSASDPPPLLVRLKCGFCPIGVFCSLIVFLISEASWELAEEVKQYRNMITFEVGRDLDRVTLIARSTCFEIWYRKQDDTHITIPAHFMCSEIRETIDDGISAVCESLSYYRQSDLDSSRFVPQFAFYCPCTAGCLPPRKPVPHPALCKGDPPANMKCIVTGKGIGIPPNHQIWYGRETKEASPMSVPDLESETQARPIRADNTSLGPSDLADAKKEVFRISHKWFDFGLQLGLQSATLHRIKLQNQTDISQCLTEMLENWLACNDNVGTKGGPTWQSLVNALQEPTIGEYGLAQAIAKRHRRKKMTLTRMKS